MTLYPTTAGARSQEDKDNIQKNGWGYTIMKKLLEMGGYLNKGYHVFIDNYFVSHLSAISIS
jgi:hypothetical protein